MPTEGARQVLLGDLREEPDAAEVDPENRDGPRREQPQRGEHRAIATQADDCIDGGCKLLILHGGLGSIEGVVLGAILLSFINNRLIPDVFNEYPSKIGLDFDLTELSFGIFGFLLVIMMVLRPQGLIPERRRKMELTEGIGVTETDLTSPGEAAFEARA